jgi:outer membrane protein assembly factor BamB
MSRLFCLLALVAVAAPLCAEDWPCWRGPRLDGTSNDEKVPLEWSKTDNVRWKVSIPGRGYSSPVVQGERIFLSTCDEDKLQRNLLCLDRSTGKELWIHDGPTEQYVASLVLHQGILFLTTGFPEYHLMGIRPDGEGNITKTKHVAWHIPHKDNGARGASYVPSPLAYDGHFFVVSDEGYLGCIEAKTGKRVYLKKLGRRHSSSPVLIQGCLIIPDDDGKVWVVKASPKFEVVRTIPMGKSIYASPAVSNGQLFLRTLNELYCIEKK